MLKIPIFGKYVSAWLLVLLMLGAGAAAVTASLAAPYGEVKVATSQTVVITTASWDSSTFDYSETKIVGQGQWFKAVVMGQGNDHGWLKMTLQNLAGSENIIKVYAKNVPPGAKGQIYKAW